MPSYIIYLIDKARRVRLGERLDCDGDEAAIAALLRAEREGGEAELWQGGRLVARLSAKGDLSKGSV